MGAMIYGVDTSYANGDPAEGTGPAWDLALDDERVKFVIARVCYGLNSKYDDGLAFTSAHDACKRRSVPFGAYMFWLAFQDPASQGTHFLQAGNGLYGDISPVVDVEEGSGGENGDQWGSVAQNIANLDKTLQRIQMRLGQPIIYTNPDTWHTRFGDTDAFSGHRLWIAEYSVPVGEATPIPGFKELVLQQYSDGQGLPPIAGLSRPTNNVDRDVLMGDDIRVLYRR